MKLVDCVCVAMLLLTVIRCRLAHTQSKMFHVCL